MVSGLNRFLTEIRTFYSLKEIREKTEEEITQYKLLLEDYSQWLGSLLRNPDATKKQEWNKKSAELQKILRSGSKRGSKGEEKKTGISTEWTQFREIQLCADDFGEAEILFEVIEELKGKIDKLEKAKNSIIDLERYGLGKEMLYVAYIHDSIPEKIVLKPKKEAKEKFEFTADLSIVKQL